MKAHLQRRFVEAYSAVRSDSFVSVEIRNASEYPDVDQLIDTVRQQTYWGALYVHPGASSQLSEAVTGQVSTYDDSQVVSYV